MKPSIHNTIAALAFHSLVTTSFANDEVMEIQKRLLNSDKVHTIAISKDRITTVSFPDAISAIDGAFMSTQPNQPGLFQLAHTKGTSFFSVRSLTDREEAQTNLNVRWENKTYVLLLQQSAEPELSIIFQKPPELVTQQNRKKKNQSVTPATLLGLLDKAKAYPFLKKHHPNTLLETKHTDHRQSPKIIKQDDFEIHIEEVFRFEPQDTLVFHLTLHNATDSDITYRPDSFTVQAGATHYPQSISDASGVMKAKTQTTVYLAITGTPSGGKNHLSPDNNFSIQLSLHDEKEALPQNIEINPSK